MPDPQGTGVQPAYTDDDVELGATAISHYDWDHGLTANAEVGGHDRGQTRAVLDALAAAGRLVPPDIRFEWAHETPSGGRREGFLERGARAEAVRRGGGVLRRIVGPWTAIDTREAAATDLEDR